MLFRVSEQGTSEIKWNIYDEYKTMQICLFAWKLTCYLFRLIFGMILLIDQNMRRSDIQNRDGQDNKDWCVRIYYITL